MRDVVVRVESCAWTDVYCVGEPLFLVSFGRTDGARVFFPVSSQALSGKKREKRAKAGLAPNTSCNVWVFLPESTCLRANCSNTIL